VTRWLLAAVLVVPVLARAEPPANLALAALEKQVASLQDPSADVRRNALSGLLQADGRGLPAVQAYLRGLPKPDPSELLEKLTQIRAGGQGEASDLTHALLTALDRDHGPQMANAAALSALLRALERQHSIDASAVIASELFAQAPGVFRGEAVRTRKRLGKLLAPGWIQARASDDVALQKLAKDGLAALNLATPQRLYGDASDPELTAALLTAAGDALASDALPWLVAYLDDPRANVRAAARRATAQFESKASELLRVRLAELTRVAPDPHWPAAELLSRVVEQEEAARTAPAREALAQAERMLSARAELAQASGLLDRALSTGVPAADRVRLARTYLALGAQLDQLNQRAEALTAFRRALRSDPTGPHAKQAQARVLYLEAEERLREGVADTQTLEASLALDPKHPGARALAKELERARDRDAVELRKWLGYAGAALLLLASLLTLRTRRIKRVPAAAA
jgi:tetratricopeptide (TPR) repeat protein